MKLLCKMKFGSHLYGTCTEKSDTDWKGIYLPSIQDCILGTVKKSVNNITKKDISQKNSSDDVDCEIYSLHHALKLAIQGETVLLDMLHCPQGWEEVTSSEWEFLKANRSKFYTKNMIAFLGYVRTQAARYGIKGSRVNAVKMVLEWLNSFSFTVEEFNTIRLGSMLDKIPQEILNNEHVNIVIIEHDPSDDKRALEVCGRKIMAKDKLCNVSKVLMKIDENYGERARLAADNKNIDWKACSHAFRAGFQLQEIYETGDLKYPLKDADFLLQVKNGEFNWVKDSISEKLDFLVFKVEELAKKSNYPEQVDKEFWNKWLVEEVYKEKKC